MRIQLVASSAACLWETAEFKIHLSGKLISSHLIGLLVVIFDLTKLVSTRTVSLDESYNLHLGFKVVNNLY